MITLCVCLSCKCSSYHSSGGGCTHYNLMMPLSYPVPRPFLLCPRGNSNSYGSSPALPGRVQRFDSSGSGHFLLLESFGQAPFEGPASVKPPDLPEDIYLRARALCASSEDDMSEVNRIGASPSRTSSLRIYRVPGSWMQFVWLFPAGGFPFPRARSGE
jgi:hypothetical protein